MHQPPISKPILLILLPPLFQKISQSPGQDQQNGKREPSVNYGPSPAELTSKYILQLQPVLHIQS